MRQLGGYSEAGLLNAPGNPIGDLIVDLEHILWNGLGTNTNGGQHS